MSRRQPGSPVMSDADRRFAVITPAVARALPREQTSQVGGEGETLNACIDRVENRQVQTLLYRTAENRGVSPPNAPCREADDGEPASSTAFGRHSVGYWSAFGRH